MCNTLVNPHIAITFISWRTHYNTKITNLLKTVTTRAGETTFNNSHDVSVNPVSTFVHKQLIPQ